MSSAAQGTSVQLSQIDEDRFGVRVARAGDVTMSSVSDVLSFCDEHAVGMLIARCAATDLETAQTIERSGGRLMDTLVYYARDLRRSPPPEARDPRVRLARASDADEVARVAADSFRGYFGHYHADARLDRSAADAAYTSWAVRSVTTPGTADEVLVAEDDGSVLGFATLRMNSADEGEGVLFGVASWAQGRGIYRAFMERALVWCSERGASTMVVSTQLTNLAVQKVWVRLGFEPSRAYYTFHRWADEASRP